MVLIVRLGLAGAVTDSGLGAHVGVPVVWTGVTVQESATLTGKSGSTVRVENGLSSWVRLRTVTEPRR